MSLALDMKRWRAEGAEIVHMDAQAWYASMMYRGIEVRCTPLEFLEENVNGYQVFIHKPRESAFWTCPVDCGSLTEALAFARGFVAGHYNEEN